VELGSWQKLQQCLEDQPSTVAVDLLGCPSKAHHMAVMCLVAMDTQEAELANPMVAAANLMAFLLLEAAKAENRQGREVDLLEAATPLKFR